MSKHYLRNRLIAGALIFAIILALHFLVTERCCAPLTLANGWRAAPIFFACLGWVAMGLLGQQGRQGLVRSIRMFVLMLAVMVVLHPEGRVSAGLLALACAVMTYAFVIAMWNRKVDPTPPHAGNA